MKKIIAFPVTLSLMVFCFGTVWAASITPPSVPVTVVNPPTKPVPVSVVNESAPVSVQYQVAGISAIGSLYPGDSSLNNFNYACQTQFSNEQARMCTSEEVIKSPNLNSITGHTGWVQPLIGSAVVVSGIVEVLDSATGLHSTTLNCDNWSATTGKGLAWNNSYLVAALCTNNLKVICCLPTVVTAP